MSRIDRWAEDIPDTRRSRHRDRSVADQSIASSSRRAPSTSGQSRHSRRDSIYEDSNPDDRHSRRRTRDDVDSATSALEDLEIRSSRSRAPSKSRSHTSSRDKGPEPRERPKRDRAHPPTSFSKYAPKVERMTAPSVSGDSATGMILGSDHQRTGIPRGKVKPDDSISSVGEKRSRAPSSVRSRSTVRAPSDYKAESEYSEHSTRSQQRAPSSVASGTTVRASSRSRAGSSYPASTAGSSAYKQLVPYQEPSVAPSGTDRRLRRMGGSSRVGENDSQYAPSEYTVGSQYSSSQVSGASGYPSSQVSGASGYPSSQVSGASGYTASQGGRMLPSPRGGFVNAPAPAPSARGGNSYQSNRQTQNFTINNNYNIQLNNAPRSPSPVEYVRVQVEERKPRWAQ